MNLSAHARCGAKDKAATTRVAKVANKVATLPDAVVYHIEDVD